MSNTNTTPTPEDVQRLQAALSKEREEHKATRSQLLAPLRSTLRLPEDAPLDTITATLTARLGDIDTQVGAKTAALATERDAAVADAAKVRAEWNTHRIDTAIQSALTKSGIRPECIEDASTILRGTLEATDKGVVTKTAAGIVPGQTVDQFIVGQLRSMRPHYWPTSVGGGAKGAGGLPLGAGVDLSGFKTGNLTKQFAAIGTYGERAVVDALRRSGIPAPAWLLRGAAR